MKWRLWAIAGALLTMEATSAYAIEGRLIPVGGMKAVIVWKDTDARDKGYELLAAGVGDSNPALILALIACVVPPGTKAVTTDMGIMTHDIMVIDGAQAGCEGNVPREAFDLPPKE